MTPEQWPTFGLIDQPPRTTVLLSWTATDPVTPEDRRRLRDALGDCVRAQMDEDVPVSVDVLATPVRDLNERERRSRLS